MTTTVGSVMCWMQLVLLTAATALKQSGPMARPIQKVAIIGSGIAGLTVAHAFENPTSSASDVETIETSLPKIDFELFDAREGWNFDAGAGVQLNGGMSVFRKINPKLLRAVANSALPLKRIRARTKPWISSGKASSSFATLFELPLEEVIRLEGGRAQEELITDDGEVLCCTIMRGTLQEVLYRALPPNKKKTVQFGKTLVGIQGHDSGEGIVCEFEDGTTAGPFDLVVGCDGIKTAVREYIDKGKIEKDARTRDSRGSIYSGIRIRYAVTEQTEEFNESELVQWFGDGAWALSGIYGSGEKGTAKQGGFIIQQDPEYIGPFKRPNITSKAFVSENVDWNQDNRVPKETQEEMLGAVQEAGIPDDAIRPIIEKSQRFFEQGVYFHNPFRLAGWSKQVKDSGGCYCVLAGDAAHAMPPFLGQGANQAIQDAYCLATQIFRHNANVLGIQQPIVEEDEQEKEDADIELKDLGGLLREYEGRRWGPTASISIKSFFLGYVEIGSYKVIAKFRDALFFTLAKLGIAQKIFLGAATPEV